MVYVFGSGALNLARLQVERAGVDGPEDLADGRGIDALGELHREFRAAGEVDAHLQSPHAGDEEHGARYDETHRKRDEELRFAEEVELTQTHARSS